ncbi:hypothetical protein [Noviherbaspirillum galbum]|uniref:Uncharacterized protein n=1 Tax=Noviherbaspirillum galbum TaxID=2709383 RepID=A0A6B3SW53_9BURK|nr:hypothetical protein [Noviherbaspirillum galbum]NEX62602.1 hypothetical protein [Noviherbaspirillum galbum]
MNRFLRHLAACLFAFAMLPPPAGAADGRPAPASPVAIDSVETADRIIEQSARARERIESQFQRETGACADRFFASSCEAEARERRRRALNDVRTQEVEANAYKRRVRTEQRDAALKERNQAAEEDRQRREGQMPATAPGHAGIPDQDLDIPRPADSEPAAAGPSERERQHAERLRRAREKEAADAPRRAEKEAAFARKAQQAEQEQQALRQRQAEKAKEAKEAEGKANSEAPK